MVYSGFIELQVKNPLQKEGLAYLSAQKNCRITIDDLGLFPEIENSALALAAHSVPIHCSWLTNFQKPTKAFQNQTSNPSLKNGLHFNILEGASALTNPELTNEKGEFYRRWVDFIFAGKKLKIATEEQLDFQLSQIKEWFPTLSHIDSHLHLHSIPWIHQLLQEKRKKHGIPHVRNPYEPWQDSKSLSPKIFLLELFQKINRAQEIPCYGISTTFTLDAERCLSLVKENPRELVWHSSFGVPTEMDPRARFLTHEQLVLRSKEHEMLERFVKAVAHES